MLFKFCATRINTDLLVLTYARKEIKVSASEALADLHSQSLPQVFCLLRMAATLMGALIAPDVCFNQCN